MHADRTQRKKQESCDYPSFKKDRYLGVDTGDVICTVCGKEVWVGEAKAIEAEREKAKRAASKRKAVKITKSGRKD